MLETRCLKPSAWMLISSAVQVIHRCIKRLHLIRATAYHLETRMQPLIFKLVGRACVFLMKQQNCTGKQSFMCLKQQSLKCPENNQTLPLKSPFKKVKEYPCYFPPIYGSPPAPGRISLLREMCIFQASILTHVGMNMVHVSIACLKRACERKTKGERKGERK